MQLLKDTILKEGFCLPGNILKVDSFVNHQIDPELTYAIGHEFAQRFADEKIDKESILRKAREEAENLMKNNNVDIAKDEKGNVTFSIGLKK